MSVDGIKSVFSLSIFPVDLLHILFWEQQITTHAGEVNVDKREVTPHLIP